jgi:hypothetical protein
LRIRGGRGWRRDGVARCRGRAMGDESGSERCEGALWICITTVKGKTCMTLCVGHRDGVYRTILDSACVIHLREQHINTRAQLEHIADRYKLSLYCIQSSSVIHYLITQCEAFRHLFLCELHLSYHLTPSLLRSCESVIANVALFTRLAAA